MNRIDITVRGDKAEQFQNLKRDLAERLGHEPSRPEVLGILMAEYDDDLDGL